MTIHKRKRQGRNNVERGETRRTLVYFHPNQLFQPGTNLPFNLFQFKERQFSFQTSQTTERFHSRGKWLCKFLEQIT